MFAPQIGTGKGFAAHTSTSAVAGTRIGSLQSEFRLT